jgi:GT2 family glycosyltransferase
VKAPNVTAIVPAYNAEATIGSCLQAIFALRPAVAEVIVYDDGATDRTHAIAAAANARVLSNNGAPRGPAHGRNAAAMQARSDLLLFVDADVVVAPASLERLLAALADGKAAAAFGSYDDRLVSRRATSVYANLRHHFVHQHSARDATTFWAGIGLIDRSIFMAIGGYDAETFARPSIEDVELGIRLVAAGHRIRLVPEALGTHHKDWSLFQVWYSDVVRRAYPWSRLIADQKTAGTDLNVAISERVTALFALAIPALLLLGFVTPVMFIAPALATAGYIGRNRRFFGFLAKRVPLPTLAAAVAMHWSYHCYSSATFAVVMIMTKLGARRRSAPLGRAD